MSKWIHHSAGLGAGSLSAASARRAKKEKVRHSDESATQRRLREDEERRALNPPRRGRPFALTEAERAQRDQEEAQRVQHRLEIERRQRTLVSLVRRELRTRALFEVAKQLGVPYGHLYKLMNHHHYQHIQAAE